MTITNKIKNEYGTVKHFCKIKGISYRSMYEIMQGVNKSKACVDALLEHKFIKDITELPQYRS